MKAKRTVSWKGWTVAGAAALLLAGCFGSDPSGAENVTVDARAGDLPPGVTPAVIVGPNAPERKIPPVTFIPRQAVESVTYSGARNSQ